MEFRTTGPAPGPDLGRPGLGPGGSTGPDRLDQDRTRSKMFFQNRLKNNLWCFICTPDQSNVTLDRLGYIFDFSSVLMLHNCLKKSWARSDLSGSVGSTGPGPGRTKLHAPGCLRKLIWQPMKNNPGHLFISFFFLFLYYFYSVF